MIHDDTLPPFGNEERVLLAWSKMLYNSITNICEQIPHVEAKTLFIATRIGIQTLTCHTQDITKDQFYLLVDLLKEAELIEMEDGVIRILPQTAEQFMCVN